MDRGRKASRRQPLSLDSRMAKNSGARTKKRIAVDGIGGVFIYANDAKELSNWYAHHFGLQIETYEDGKVYGTEFKYRRLSDSSKVDSTVFSISQSKTTLPAERLECVVNYRVHDLPAFLEQLKAEGVAIEKTEDYDYGRFARIRDPEGNRIELYEPLN